LVTKRGPRPGRVAGLGRPSGLGENGRAVAAGRRSGELLRSGRGSVGAGERDLALGELFLDLGADAGLAGGLRAEALFGAANLLGGDGDALVEGSDAVDRGEVQVGHLDADGGGGRGVGGERGEGQDGGGQG